MLIGQLMVLLQAALVHNCFFLYKYVQISPSETALALDSLANDGVRLALRLPQKKELQQQQSRAKVAACAADQKREGRDEDDRRAPCCKAFVHCETQHADKEKIHDYVQEKRKKRSFLRQARNREVRIEGLDGPRHQGEHGQGTQDHCRVGPFLLQGPRKKEQKAENPENDRKVEGVRPHAKALHEDREADRQLPETIGTFADKDSEAALQGGRDKAHRNQLARAYGDRLRPTKERQCVRVKVHLVGRLHGCAVDGHEQALLVEGILQDVNFRFRLGLKDEVGATVRFARFGEGDVGQRVVAEGMAQVVALEVVHGGTVDRDEKGEEEAQ